MSAGTTAVKWKWLVQQLVTGLRSQTTWTLSQRPPLPTTPQPLSSSVTSDPELKNGNVTSSAVLPELPSGWVKVLGMQ